MGPGGGRYADLKVFACTAERGVHLQVRRLSPRLNWARPRAMPAECCIHGSAAALWNLPTRTGVNACDIALLRLQTRADGRWHITYVCFNLRWRLVSTCCAETSTTALRRWLHPRLCAARKAASAQPFMAVVAVASMLNLCCAGILLSDGPAPHAHGRSID